MPRQNAAFRLAGRIQARADQAAREVRDAVAAQAQDIVDALEMVTPIDRGLLITQWGFTVFPDEVLIYNFTRYAGFGGRDELFNRTARNALNYQRIAEEVA
jgi:hypothetical protein